MPTKRREFTPAQVRYMQVSHERGKSYCELGLEFKCSDKLIATTLKRAGLYKPKKRPKKEKPKKSIREILEEEKEKEQLAKFAKRGCHILCCNDRKSCTEINDPQNCPVWRLYNQKSKEHLIIGSGYTKRRAYND